MHLWERTLTTNKISHNPSLLFKTTRTPSMNQLLLLLNPQKEGQDSSGLTVSLWPFCFWIKSFVAQLPIHTSSVCRRRHPELGNTQPDRDPSDKFMANPASPALTTSPTLPEPDLIHFCDWAKLLSCPDDHMSSKDSLCLPLPHSLIPREQRVPKVPGALLVSGERS